MICEIRKFVPTRREDGFTARVPGSHGKRVLPAVDGYPQLLHDVAHGPAREHEVGALVLADPRRPHPVAAALDVPDVSDQRAGHVGQHLGHGHPRTGLGRDEDLEGLLSDGRSCTNLLREEPCIGLKLVEGCSIDYTVPPDHLLLDIAPNLGPLISPWEITKNSNSCKVQKLLITEASGF